MATYHFAAKPAKKRRMMFFNPLAHGQDLPNISKVTHHIVMFGAGGHDSHVQPSGSIVIPMNL